MATSSEYLEYVRERVERFGALREKKMFGEYILYLNEKPVFLICDNTVYMLKRDRAGDAGLPHRRAI